GVDLALEAIRLGRRRGLRNVSVGSAEALPFRDDAFDGVAALDIVEHTDDVRTLAEIARVVRPGGVVLVHVPAFPFLWGEHDEVNHHRRRYRRAELLAALRGWRAPGGVGRDGPPRPPHLVRQLRALSRRRCGPSRKTVAAQAPGTTSTTSRGVRPATLAESHADRLPRARAPGVAPSRH